MSRGYSCYCGSNSSVYIILQPSSNLAVSGSALHLTDLTDLTNCALPTQRPPPLTPLPTHCAGSWRGLLSELDLVEQVTQ